MVNRIRSLSGNGLIPFLIKEANRQFSWIGDSKKRESEVRDWNNAFANMCCWHKYEEVNYFLQQLRLLLLLPLRIETLKNYSNQKGLKQRHLSPLMKSHKILFLYIVNIQETFNFLPQELYLWDIYNFCPSKIRLTWSYLFSVNPILTQQTCRWTNKELSEFYNPITTCLDKKNHKVTGERNWINIWNQTWV